LLLTCVCGVDGTGCVVCNAGVVSWQPAAVVVVDVCVVLTGQDASSVTLALSLDNQLFSGRRLRVQRSTEKPKPTPRKNSSMSLKRHGTSKVSFNVTSLLIPSESCMCHTVSVCVCVCVPLTMATPDHQCRSHECHVSWGGTWDTSGDSCCHKHKFHMERNICDTVDVGRFDRKLLNLFTRPVFGAPPHRGWPRHNFTNVFSTRRARMIGLPNDEESTIC